MARPGDELRSPPNPVWADLGCMMRVAVLGLLMLQMACARQPERVFVPGTPFKHVVEVRTSQGVAANIRVGEWLTLHGRRSTGPGLPQNARAWGPTAAG